MAGQMFNGIISGPVNSKKLGRSLVVNLLPENDKLCSFNCVYCSCEEVKVTNNKNQDLPQPYAVVEQLVNVIQESQKKGERIDAISFSGNGEPTLHPDFDDIISDVVLIRNLLTPDTKIVVFTNGSAPLDESLKQTIAKADQFIVKLDAGTTEMFQKINRPIGKLTIDQIKKNLMEFKGVLTIQSVFIKAGEKGGLFDNSSNEEVKVWLEHIKDITPKKVYLGSIKQPSKGSILKAVSKDRLAAIASEIKSFGIEATVV